MSRATVIITLLTSLFASASWAGEGPPSGPTAETPPSAELEAQAPGLKPRTGLSAALGAALSTCLPNGAADCSNTYPGLSLTGALERRFWYLGLALEFDYGAQLVSGSGSDQVSSTTTHVTPTLKGYYPLQGWEAFFGLGLGYSSISVSEERSSSSASWSTFWRGVKLSGGAWYDLAPHGYEGFTLDIAAQLFLNSGGSRCTEYAGAEACFSEQDLDPAQRDVAHHLQLTTALRYTF